MATRTTTTTITTSNSQSHSQSHSRRLAPESPKRDDLASHTRRGLAQLTSAAASTSRNSLRDKSTTYQPRLESSALFGVNSSSNQDQRHGQKRDDNLALCEMDEEELEKRRGPRYFYAPEDDKEWDRVEPNSCIRLRSRKIPHTSVQALLDGLIHLSPSLLYSIVRPQFANAIKRGYGGGGGDLEVPVVGEWITIGVLVEKSPIRITNGPQELVESKSDEDVESNSNESGNEDAPPKIKITKQEKTRPRKFISFKLVDLGHESYATDSGSSTTSVTAARSSLRGDAILNLMLFEASRSSKGTTDNTGRRGGISEIVYTGGSGGAFEKFAKETEGAVIAIRNPRVMPLQKNKSSVGQILSLNPTSAASITVIGRSADYGQCQAIKKDGNRCGGFADKRSSNGICEFHVQLSLEKNKSKGGRGEFSNSTGPTTALGNPPDSSSSKGAGKWKGPPSMAHFKTVKQEKDNFGTSFPIKQEFIKKGPMNYGPRLTKGVEGMLAPKTYHVEHRSSRDFDPNNPNSFAAGLGEASLPRSHIKASNPQSLLFDVTERYGRGRAEKEERIRKREREEELLRLLERKAAGDEDEDLLREDRERRGESSFGGSKRDRDQVKEESFSGKKREYDQDGTEIIRKRKKISVNSSASNIRPQQIDADGNQSSVFMGNSTQSITSGGKAIREAQIEIAKRKEKAEKLRLDKIKEREDRKNSIKPTSSNNPNPFVRNTTRMDASFDRDLNSVLTSRTVSNEVYEKDYSDDDDKFRRKASKKIKRRPIGDTPLYANVRRGQGLQKAKRSQKEKERDAKRVAKGRAKGLALNEHDSDLESAESASDNDGLERSFGTDRRRKSMVVAPVASSSSSSSSSSRTSRVRNPAAALRSSSEESGNDDEIDFDIPRDRHSKDKGKGKEKAQDAPGQTLPGMDIEFSDDSDMERDKSGEGNQSHEAVEMPTSAQTASSSTGQAQPRKWAHSVDAVQKMGYDPFAGARGFERKRLEAEKSTPAPAGSDVKSRLLSRLSAASDNLPKPILNSSNSRSGTNLSSIALKSLKEAKEKRLLALKLSKGSRKEKRVGSDSEEESGDEEMLKDPLLEIDLNSNKNPTRVRTREQVENDLDLDLDLELELQGNDWDEELEEVLRKADQQQSDPNGKGRRLLQVDDSSDLEIV